MITIEKNYQNLLMDMSQLSALLKDSFCTYYRISNSMTLKKKEEKSYFSFQKNLFSTSEKYEPIGEMDGAPCAPGDFFTVMNQ